MVADSSSIHTARIARMLCERGIRVAVVSGNGNRNSEIPKEAEILSIPKPVISLPKIRGLSVIYRLRKLWKQCQPDIVHVHYVATEAWYCAVARIRPLVVTCWGSDIHSIAEKNEAGLSKPRIQYVLRHAALVTGDCGTVLEHAEEVAGGLKSKMLWRIGIDTEKFHPGIDTRSLRERLGLRQEERLILSPRAMRPLMNHHLVLEAFAKIADQFPATVLAFKTYGMHISEAKAYLNRIKERVSDLRLSGRVIFLADTDYCEMPLLYNLADVIVNIPSRDGMPMTLFEAMASGRVCVVSEIDTYRELTFGQNSCPLISVKIDIKSIANGIACALSGEQSERIPAVARKTAQELGNQEIETNRLINAYKDILGGESFYHR